MSRVDAIVVGGGLVGGCVAGFLAEAGMDVTIFDVGHGAGSTANAGSLHVQMQSRSMRLYPANVPEMEAQLPLYPRAVAFWQEFERALGADLELKISGGLMVAESAGQLDFLRQKSARERALGLDVSILDRTDLDAIAPYLGPSIVGAELCANEGKLNPLLCNAAVRDWTDRLGVRRREGVEVTRIERGDGRYCIDGVSAPRLALAAGWGVGPLSAALGCAIPAKPEPLHMNITEPTAPFMGHLVQHADRMITLKQLGSGQVVIGGGWPARLGDGALPPEVEFASLAASASLAQHVVPRLGPLSIIRCWAGYNTTVDGRGVLGSVSGYPGLFVAVPGDAGYTLGPLSARMVADVMLDRTPAEEIDPFTPDRFRH